MKFTAHKRLFRALGTCRLAIKLEGTQLESHFRFHTVGYAIHYYPVDSHNSESESLNAATVSSRTPAAQRWPDPHIKRSGTDASPTRRDLDPKATSS